MVTLNNIKVENNIVSAEYFPEDKKTDIGKIVYNIESRTVIEQKYCRLDEESNLKTYFHKAVKAIEKCIGKNDFPETTTYMWY